MEQVLEFDKEKAKSIAITIAKAVALTLSFAIVYYLICMASPELAKSSLQGIIFGKTLRIANALKAFSLITPFASIGTSLGAHWFNVSTGSALILSYPVSSMLHAGVGIGAWLTSKKLGRSLGKDALILFAYAVLTAIIVSINLIAIGSLFNNGDLSLVIKAGIQFQIISNLLFLYIGYGLLRTYEFGKSKLDEKNSSSK